tara:strand:+ start:946 stop:1140 length:195 start_codon:yes stop_codon:yes gene_type:complete
MSTITQIKEVEFYPYKAVAVLYDGRRELWKVMGVNKNKPNTTLFEGDDAELAQEFFNVIVSNDK